jgi:cell division protein FtsQ
MNKEEHLYQLKRIGIIALWVLLLSGLVVSLAFVQHEQKGVRCKEIVITISPENDNFFVDRSMVISILTNEGRETDLLGKPLGQLDVSALELKLERNPFISNAEVYADINGDLKIDVHQRRPVMRVMLNDGTGYYIDNKGFKMPLSELYTAHIIVATGNISENYGINDSLRTNVTHELYKLAEFLEKDEFWKAQVEQVYVNEKSDLILVPKIGDHTIVLGSVAGIEEKMNRLMVFYTEALNKMGWNDYSTINLKYEGQIVCTKKNQLNTYEQQ